MADCMMFPKDWHDFIKDCSFIDSKQVYTNGSELIQVFRVTQLIEHLLKEQEGIVPYIDIDEAKCPVCKVKLTRQELLGDNVLYEDFYDYCPHCGRKVKWES